MTQNQSVDQRIADQLGVAVRQVSAAVGLLDGGATVPFIARYRKEATGGLDDAQLRTLDERLRYLDMGADDFVVKPFSMKELLARVRVLLRRRVSGEERATESIFTIGDLVIDFAQRQVFVQDRQVQLSRTEYKLLHTLAQNVGRVMTHELLLERVWGAEYNREVDFIWVYISRLRRKIEADPRHPRYILTIPDVGYKLAKL